MNKSEKTEELVKILHVENTPFTVVSEVIEEETLHFVSLGMYRMTDYFESIEDAVKWANEITWDKITSVISLLFDILNKKLNTK